MMKIKISTLIILAACLSLTACSPQVAFSFSNPATRPTATPSAPIHTIPEIVEVLNQLAQKNMSMVQKQGWWHRTNTVIEQSGDLHSPNFESWFYLPQDPSKCLLRMDVSSDPDTGDIMLWQMQTEYGYLGDLISLRRGDSEVIKVDPSLCRLTQTTTEAGYLALSLQGEALGKDSRNTREWAKAWYEEQDGKPVFCVHAVFKTSFEKLTTQTEIYSFDVQSGMALKHYLGMGYEFDTAMGRFITQNYFEFWEEMPKDVAAQYEQASKELKSYAAGAVDTSSSTSSPEPTTQPIDLQSLMQPYTKENPLIDKTQLVAAVQELVRRQAAWMSEPGWLLQEQIFGDGKDFTRQQYTLVHITGDKGECREQMVYFYNDGGISPWIVRLENGIRGNLYSLEQSEDTSGQIKENTSCSLSDGESVFVEGDFLLVDESDELSSFISNDQNGLIDGDVKAWFEVLDDRLVFVLAYHTEKEAADGGLIMNPTIQELEPYTQSNKLNYYDMENGVPVWEVESYTLQSGFVTEFGEGLRYSWEKYTELPDEIKQAYDQAAEALKLNLAPD